MLTAPSFPITLDAVICPANYNSVGRLIVDITGQGAPTSTANPTANKAYYIPFAIDRQITVYRVGWHNGSAAQSGTRETGVYDSAGTKIISGSATASGTSVCQFVDVTDTLIGPGVYYLAHSDSGTATVFAWAPAVPSMAAMGIYTQTTANPLPSTATFAVDNAAAFLPLAFLQCRSVM